MLFEMEGVTREVAAEAMRLAAMKLSVPTKFIVREQPLDVATKAEVAAEAAAELAAEKAAAEHSGSDTIQD